MPGISFSLRGKGIVAAHLAAVAVMAVCFWSRLIDDSFIFYRFGKNLMEFGVWGWNPSGVPEQAYTSFLFAAMSVVPAALHVSPLLFFKLLGLLVMLVLPLRIYALTRAELPFLLAVLLVSCNPYFAICAFSGMETVFFAWLLFELSVCLEQDYAACGPSRWGVTLTILLPLMRPEGLLFSLAYWGFLLRRERGPRSLRRFLFFCLVLAAYELASTLHFHSLLPNPFYVKVVAQGGGWRKLAGAFLGLRIYWFAAFFGWLLYRNPRWRAFLLIACTIALFLYGPAELVLDYANRFRFQVFVPLFLSLLVCSRHAAKRNDLALAVVAALVCVGPITREEIAVGLDARAARQGEAATRSIGMALNSSPHLRVLLWEAGAIPYYSDCNCTDGWGLGTRRVTRNRLGFSDLLRERPDAIVLYHHSATGEGPSSVAFDDEARQQIEATGEYQCVRTVHYIHELWLPVYVRRDLPQAAEIARRLSLP